MMQWMRPFGVSVAITIAAIAAQVPIPSAISQTPTSPRFSDITGQRYATEIEQAVTQGVIAGFEDNTFRPNAKLTREQAVSMVVEALKRAPLQNANALDVKPPELPAIPAQASGNLFSDVAKTRWSATKIEYAKELGLIQGYADRTFRPTQPITRAELVVVLQQAYRYLVELRGWNGREFIGGDEPINFSDTRNHWAQDAIRLMSANCRAAAPINETGTAFGPNLAAERSYGAAALMRTAQCWSIPMRPPS